MGEHAKLGTLSCISLITNKMIGTGLFSTPAIIFKYCRGNVALFLGLWLLGALIILSGLLIYLEYALNLPFRNGGEKNYLLRVFRRPTGLIGCIYSFQMVFLGFSSGNSFAFGKYLWFAVTGSSTDDDAWPSKAIGVACITFCIWLHIKYPHKGTSLFNFLGMFKIVILFLIVAIGFLVAVGMVNVSDTKLGDTSTDMIEVSVDPYPVSVALLQVIYSFKGWENANYVLSELKDPYHALTVTAPLSVLLVTVLYFLVVVSYLVVIPRQEFLSSGVLVAGIFFNKVFGESMTSRLLPVFISLSTLGNVMVVSYAHSRVNQELANENYLPFSRYFRNLNHSLILHWAISVIVLVAPPSTEIYEFVVNLYIYPGTWINLLLTGGLIYLKLSPGEDWMSGQPPSILSIAGPSGRSSAVPSLTSASQNTANENTRLLFAGSSSMESNQKASDSNQKTLDANLKSPDTHYKSPNTNYKSSEINFKSPDPNFKSPDPNFKSPDTNYKSPGTNFKSPDTNLKIPESTHVHSQESASHLSEDEADSYVEFDSLLSQTSGAKSTKSFSAPWICTSIFLVANIFLAVFPFVPPPASYTQGSIPYWCFPAVGTGSLLAGAVFYYFRRHYTRMRGLEPPFYGQPFLG